MQTSPRTRKPIKIGILILACLVVLVGGAALYFWFGLVKPYIEGHERPRVPLLKKIAAAQQKFKVQDLDKDGIRDYAGLKELFKAKLLTDREVYKAGFVFVEPVTSDPKNRWWAVAQPLHPMQGRAFFTNHTGDIYQSTDEPNVESRVSRKTGAIPAGMQEWKELD